jgi:hypothetical protein
VPCNAQLINENGIMRTLNKSRRIYKISDLAKELDRCPHTIKRWEARGLIPKARRDSRGWRYYNDDDVKKLIKVIKESNYFINVPEQ